MDVTQLRELLSAVHGGSTSVDDAVERLRRLPFEQLPFATLDHHRAIRCGHPEVIFCPGKTVQQVLGVAQRLAASGGPVLATRASDDQLSAMASQFPNAVISHQARAALLNEPATPVEPKDGEPLVVVISAGTADIPVAEEALFTLRAMQVPAQRVLDVGVSGLHRLLSHVEAMQRACAVVVIAGMEGALPSVVGGLVACPVFAVPTSVGYGASFNGLAALLGMLNSCASSVSVVNIDNGFGAAFSAGLVYKQVIRTAEAATSEEVR